MHVAKSSRRYTNQLPQPLAPVDPFPTLKSSAATLVFLRGPRVVSRATAEWPAAWQRVKRRPHSHSIHWGWIDASIRTTPPFPTPVPICQPRIVGRHSTVQLTSATVKLTYANFLSFLPDFFLFFVPPFLFRGKGRVRNNKVRGPVAGLNKVDENVPKFCMRQERDQCAEILGRQNIYCPAKCFGANWVGSLCEPLCINKESEWVALLGENNVLRNKEFNPYLTIFFYVLIRWR